MQTHGVLYKRQTVCNEINALWTPHDLAAHWWLL